MDRVHRFIWQWTDCPAILYLLKKIYSYINPIISASKRFCLVVQSHTKRLRDTISIVAWKVWSHWLNTLIVDDLSNIRIGGLRNLSATKRSTPFRTVESLPGIVLCFCRAEVYTSSAKQFFKHKIVSRYIILFTIRCNCFSQSCGPLQRLFLFSVTISSYGFSLWHWVSFSFILGLWEFSLEHANEKTSVMDFVSWIATDCLRRGWHCDKL